MNIPKFAEAHCGPKFGNNKNKKDKIKMIKIKFFEKILKIGIKMKI